MKEEISTSGEFVNEAGGARKVVARPDVLVVGAGPAGIGAAVSAARNGAKTMLVERYGFPGGAMTQAMVAPMFTFHDVNGRRIIGGIAQEYVERLKSMGASFGHVTDLTFDNASMTTFDPEAAKLAIIEMLQQAGVDMLFHTHFSDSVVGDGKIEALIMEGKSGRFAIAPRYVVDCTADADIAARAGAKFFKGRPGDGAMQPATLYFRIGGVDDAKLRAWMKANRELLKDSPTAAEIDSQKCIALLGLKDLICEAERSGEIDSQAAPRVLMYGLPRRGEFSVNTTRLQNVDGTDCFSLTRAEIALRKQVVQVFGFLRKNIGGLENSYIIDTGAQVGVRETRHIEGDYVLTEQDILKSRAFADGICCGAFAIDIHPPEGKAQIFTGSGRSVYEIPYRALLPKGLGNLIVAGRSISATHAAFGSVRVMATCMACGQGAGTAAALLCESGGNSRGVDIAELRRRLVRDGQYLLNAGIKDEVDESLKLVRQNGCGDRAAHYNPFANM